MGAMKDSYRQLTDWERRLIQRLLAIPFSGRDALLVQLDHISVTSMDEDGTPLDENGSLYLNTSSSVKASVKSPVPVEGKIADTDGVIIHYLLFVNEDGKIDQLEIYKDDLSKVRRHADTEALEVIVAG